jgi:uncharacterized protein (AIM24 family)
LKLILAILGVLTRKVVALAVLAVALVTATLVWNWVREQSRVTREVEAAQVEVATTLQEWRTRKAALLKVEAQLDALRAEEPAWYQPAEKIRWRARVAAAEAAVDSARAARDQAHAAWQGANQRLREAAGQVDTAWAGIWNAARQTGWQWGGIIVVVAAGPLLWKAFWYYGLAALASYRPPARITPSQQPGTLRASGQGKVLEVQVVPDQPLVARMDWVQQYSPGLSKRTRLLFEWRSPFTSYAAGLAEMTELAAAGPGGAGSAVLTAGLDPNAYLLALELTQHPGVVLRPGAVVGVQGRIQLRPRWHLASLHHWIAGRVRHILFCGTGTVYVTGCGGVELTAAGAPTVIEEALVVGYDSRSAFAAARTETFWPYFRNKTSLFDYRFEAGHAAIRQATATPAARRTGNALVRTVDAVLNGIGRLLGL